MFHWDSGKGTSAPLQNGLIIRSLGGGGMDEFMAMDGVSQL